MIPPEDIADRDMLVRPEAMVPPPLWLVSSDAGAVTGWRYQAKLWPPNASPRSRKSRRRHSRVDVTE
ncbi:MAG TPA: hypothetical protein VGH62_08870 [Bradyrhizobium sp.]|jgi:hypothetical protein